MASEKAADDQSFIETRVPARLDRLPFGVFHLRMIIALGITWILDGLEVTLAGSLAGALVASPTLHFNDWDIGLISGFYLAGAVVGALIFGWLTDRYGRKKLFFITLGLYAAATAATAFSFNLASFCLFRFLTGAGIGGEYSAINSTIQEFTPARLRGRVDMAINGSFWVGGALGAAASIYLLNPAHFSADMGWRAAFFIGALLALGILALRTFIPESPRWLVIHGHEKKAEAIVGQIEAEFSARNIALSDPETLKPLRIKPRSHTPLAEVFRALFVTFRPRTLVGLALMSAQSFFYNAIFFTYALVLTTFYKVPHQSVGLYVFPFAAGNVFGPLLLGPLFDKIGRKPMVAATYAIAGILLAVSAVLFDAGVLDAKTQTISWMIVFFFASAAASAAYLTVSEIFPVEIRALAIAVFYAVGTGIGGVAAPVLFGALIQTEKRGLVLIGYLVGAALMIGAGIVQALFGVAAEGKSLESVAQPLSSEG
ncbi:MAG: MFS transporter [Methylovirgula sp.]|uniref:MFS transporter n=1 Tax=Methylovirgula sp. TaxID=1978224 RepID=UPI0030761973